MSTNIHRANTINISKITYEEPTNNKYGGRSCKVKYEGQDLYIQTPRMRLPYGLGIYDKDKNGTLLKDAKYSLDLSFLGYENNEDGVPSDPKVRDFFDTLNKMHDSLVKAALRNSNTWLYIPECNESIAKALVRETVKFPRDKKTRKIVDKYPPTLKAKLTYWDNKFLVNAYDEDKNLIQDLKSYIVPKTEVVAILKLTGVNFSDGKCGFAFQATQIKLYKPAGMLSYAFIEDEDTARPVKSSNDNDDDDNDGSNNLVNDSDDDKPSAKDELDGDDEEEEAPPTPAPVVAVPVVSKINIKKTTKK